MILDRRSGQPIKEQRLLTRDTRAKTYYPETLAMQRNEVISGRMNPVTHRPMWLESNLINDPNNDGMEIWNSNGTKTSGSRSSYAHHAMPSFPYTQNSYWRSTDGGDGQYLAFWNKGNLRKATRYTITVENGYTPRVWRFEGSNDGAVWTTLHSYEQLDTWPNGISQHWFDVPIENQDFYTRYRFIVDACDAVDVRIRNFLVLANDDSTDSFLHIVATEEDPLIISFADGTATHVVTLTESRLVDMRGIWPGLGVWQTHKRSSQSVIIAEYNPVTGALSFGTHEQESIPEGGAGFEVYRNYSNYDYNNPLRALSVDGNYVAGYKESNSYYSLVKTAGSFFFNKVAFRSYLYGYTNNLYVTPSKVSGVDIPIADLQTYNSLPNDINFFTIPNEINSDNRLAESFLSLTSVFEAKRINFLLCSRDYRYRYSKLYYSKFTLDQGLALKMKPDGKMYTVNVDGSLSHKRWVPVGYCHLNNTTNHTISNLDENYFCMGILHLRSHHDFISPIRGHSKNTMGAIADKELTRYGSGGEALPIFDAHAFPVHN